MPRRKSISNSKVEDFEPRKKNPLGLLDDANLDAHLKSIKIGDKLTPVKLSDNEVRFDADFSLNGKFKTHNLETDNQYMHLKVNHSVGYVVMDALYTSHVDATGNYPLNAYNVGQSGVFIDHTGGSYLGGIFTTCGNGKFTWGKTSESGGLEYQYSYNGIRLLDKTDTGDYCQLSVDTHGATTLSTVDDDAAAGHLTLDADGQIVIDSVNTANDITDGTLLKTSGTTFGSITAHHSLSTLTLFEAGGSSTDDYFTISVDSAGATTMTTVDAGGANANLIFTVDGDITLDPAGNDVFLSGSHLTLDAQGKVGFDGSGGHTYVFEENDDFVSFVVGGQSLMALQEKAGTSVAQSSKIYTGCPVMLKDIAGEADTPVSGYGSVYVNSDVLYFKNDSGTVTNLLSGGGGTTRWVRNTGGYATNKTSTTLYYFQFRPNSDLWSNSDSSPTSINVYDAPACQFHAPADGTLTNITASGYVNDTGATDPFKFYVYKGTPANDGTNTSLTLIGTSDAPATISSSAKTFSINTDISSSNSFSAGDGLWVMWKKDSNTGSQDVYFSVTISGEYD